MTAPLTIRRPTDPADPALVAVERIYVDSLPAGERKPTAWLRSLAYAADAGGAAPAPSYRLLVAERDGDALGFAVLFIPPDPADAALLEYLAVADRARGGGVGGQLFDAAVGLADRPVLVEVEAGDADADRRRAFYRRHGCRELLGLRYLLPLPAAPPMGLMVAGAAKVRRADLTRWLATVYVGAYGQRPDDPRVAEMPASLSDPVAWADG